MTFEKIFGDVFGDDRFELFEQIEVAAAQFSGDFEAYVEELAQVVVERGILLIVPQGGYELV